MGFRVVHDKEGGEDVSHAIHKATGNVVEIHRVGRVFELDLDVVDPKELKKELEKKQQQRQRWPCPPGGPARAP